MEKRAKLSCLKMKKLQLRENSLKLKVSTYGITVEHSLFFLSYFSNYNYSLPYELSIVVPLLDITAFLNYNIY